MSENNPHIKKYTLSDIENYLSGKLSPAEMHSLEKAALNDPFLADAIEGFEGRYNGSDELRDDIEKIKVRLNNKTDSKKKVTPFFTTSLLWKAAAILVISGSLVVLTYNLLKTPAGDKMMAMTVVHQQDSIEKLNSDSETSSVTAMEQRIKPPPEFKTKEPKKELAKPVTNTPAASNAAPLYDSAYSMNEAELSTPSGIKMQKDSPVSSQLQGKVAGISIEKNDYSKSRKAASRYGAEENTRPIPENGWVKFEEYLDSNKITDPSINIRGEVIVEFVIDKRGHRTRYNITQSLSPAQDAEAIRLLKEGPAWKNPSKKKQKVSVIINF